MKAGNKSARESGIEAKIRAIAKEEKMAKKKQIEIVGAAVVNGGVISLRETILGVEDGEYCATAEVVDGEVLRVVIDFSDPLLPD